MLNPTDFIKNDNDFANFGKHFLQFYLENGFGDKSKADIDCAVYDLFCNLKVIDDTESALVIGRRLQATETSIKKYKEDRFYKHKVDDEKLKSQIKEIFKNNFSKMSNNKIVFTVSNISAKLYIEELLHNSNQNYDYTHNPNNISLSCETFDYIAKLIDCNLENGLQNYIQDTEVKYRLGNDYIVIQNIITAPKTTTTDKIFNIINTLGSVAKIVDFLSHII